MSKSLIIKTPNSVKEVLYLDGFPFSYRFDGKTGQFKNKRGRNIVAEEKFSIIPIGVECFNAPDNYMGQDSYSGRPFVNLYFINEKGALSSIMFHSGSVHNLGKELRESFYDGVEFLFSRLTMTSEKKKSEEGHDFYVINFEIAKADPKEVSHLESIAAPILENSIISNDTKHCEIVSFDKLDLDIPTNLLETPES